MRMINSINAVSRVNRFLVRRGEILVIRLYGGGMRSVDNSCFFINVYAVCCNRRQ